MRLHGVLLSLCSLPLSAWAALNNTDITKEILLNGKADMQVIYSHPDAQPAEPFYEPILPTAPQRAEPVIPDAIRAPIPFQLRQLFPIHTPTMQPGRYRQTPVLAHEQLPNRPLCILGTDPLSREWFRLNQQVLRERRVHCLCVEAPRVEDWQALQDIAPDIIITPVSVPDFAKVGITHYPVLLEPGGIQQ